MLHDQTAADDLNVDGHAMSIRSRRRTGRIVRWRARLIFRFRQREAPDRDIHVLDRRMDYRGNARVHQGVVFHVVAPFLDRDWREPVAPAALLARLSSIAPITTEAACRGHQTKVSPTLSYRRRRERLAVSSEGCSLNDPRKADARWLIAKCGVRRHTRGHVSQINNLRAEFGRSVIRTD